MDDVTQVVSRFALFLLFSATSPCICLDLEVLASAWMS